MKISIPSNNVIATIALSSFVLSGVDANCSPEVTSLSVVDHIPTSGLVVATATNGGSFTLPYSLGKFNICAETSGCVGSVQVIYSDLGRNVPGDCESYTPYTVFGDPSSQDFSDAAANYGVYGFKTQKFVGLHTVAVKPWSGENCSGTPGPSVSVDYEILSCNPEVKMLSFVDHVPTRGHVVATATDGGSVTLPYNLGKFNIRAEKNHCVQSLQIIYSDVGRNVPGDCELYTPYTVFGDPSPYDFSDDAANYGKFGFRTQDKVGKHNVTVKPWSGENCTGAPGPTVTVDYEILSCSPAVTMLSFVDHAPTSGLVVAAATNGGSVTLPYNLGKFNIRAEKNHCVQSVQIVSSDAGRNVPSDCELYTPYTVFGDQASSDLSDAAANYGEYGFRTQDKVGQHTVTVKPWSGKNCTGSPGPLVGVAYKILAK